MVSPRLRPPCRHLAGGLCHRRREGVARDDPQPLRAGDVVYRQRLAPCRARGGPRQPADRGLRVALGAAVQTARHGRSLRSPRVWRAVSTGGSAIACPSRALLRRPGLTCRRMGLPDVWPAPDGRDARPASRAAHVLGLLSRDYGTVARSQPRGEPQPAWVINTPLGLRSSLADERGIST